MNARAKINANRCALGLQALPFLASCNQRSAACHWRGPGWGSQPTPRPAVVQPSFPAFMLAATPGRGADYCATISHSVARKWRGPFCAFGLALQQHEWALKIAEAGSFTPLKEPRQTIVWDHGFARLF
ncbi:hypothetical protein DL89DRAFT_101142 [Linderina pennispora]|uniref:Uncharacterized protein n=1 Tax=Linderina pennispora TaxID=61395 RepID=A0A1Y1VVY7_9FUNG|nr:uncharacterized protein DL89DRAFT_101142 [Linderina pennispora]ORX65457.1 hypothetical protein DL89DRAFT_101142 [Linderina pennispora]